jgi:hypothetical protein
MPSRRDPAKTQPSISGQPTPRLPHEHDESSDSQHSEPRRVVKQGEDDVQRGLVDTDRGEPARRTYERLRRGAAPQAPPRTSN